MDQIRDRINAFDQGGPVVTSRADERASAISRCAGIGKRYEGISDISRAMRQLLSAERAVQRIIRRYEYLTQTSAEFEASEMFTEAGDFLLKAMQEEERWSA